MNIAFEYRQAVQVRTNTADQHMVTVEHQMLRGDSGRQQFIAVTHILGGIFGGDMLKDHLQSGQALAQRLHHGFNKARFAIEYINLGVGDFPMYQQRHPQFFHPLQHRHNGVGAGDAVAGVGGGVGRVELGGGEYAFVKAALQLRRVEGVCQIAGHQRGKIMPGRHGVHNALAVSDSRRDGGDRRHQIRHHDRPAIKLTGIRHDGFQHIVIAQMDMPVVWAADFQYLGLCCHGRLRLIGSVIRAVFCRALRISVNVFLCTHFRKKFRAP